MIIRLKPETKKSEIERLVAKLRMKGLQPNLIDGHTTISFSERLDRSFLNDIAKFSCVDEIIETPNQYKLVSKQRSVRSVIKISDVTLGGDDFVVIAGPCALENEKQILETAMALKKMGIKIMRASIFKPRTSPYSFQGLGLAGLKLLKEVKKKTGLLIETEVMDVRDVKRVAECVDILRVGSRNMMNYDLLKEMGKIDKPIILKRGMSATIHEFMSAAEYILSAGNSNVILCERGIRTFESAYRNTLDLASVAILKNETHLPVIVDPSHAAGRRDLVLPLSRAAVAVGADGLLIETHPNPEMALSDGEQSLYLEQLSELLRDIRAICTVVGRNL